MKIWCLDYRDRVWTDAAMQDFGRLRGVKLMRGGRYSESFPADIVVDIRFPRRPADFFEAGVYWILSPTLKTILDSFAVDAEYFPVNLARRGKALTDGPWYCFNPTLVVDWFDRVHSQFTLNQGFATEIERVAVDLEKFGDAPLSVASKTIPILVGVRDDLADAIISSGCTGAVFRSPEEWRNPINPIEP
jgi:hypothetical protein